MANHRISKSKRALILALIGEGNTINGTCRMLKVGKPGLLRFLLEAAEACEDWHNRHFVNLTVEQLQLDEQWSYINKHKERMVLEEKRDHPDWGDSWLWAGIDRESKAIIGWHTGKRDGMSARVFTDDLASRIEGELDVCSDHLNSYKYAIRGSFGARAHHAEIIKEFPGDAKANVQIKKPVNRLLGLQKEAVSGTPDLKEATTSHIERFFLTTRQGNKRKTRKTLAYSKKFENHAAANSLFLFLYNTVRKHETLKEAPAVALGVIEKRWSLEQVVDMIQDYFDAKKELTKPKFTAKPKNRLPVDPMAPKTPWYLDPESGGPNPEVRKPGIAYAGDSDVT